VWGTPAQDLRKALKESVLIRRLPELLARLRRLNGGQIDERSVSMKHLARTLVVSVVVLGLPALQALGQPAAVRS